MRSLTGGVCIKLLTKLRDNPIRSPLAVGGKAALLNEKIARGRLLVLPLCLIAPKFLANGLGPGLRSPRLMLRGPPRKASDSTYRSIERIRKPDCSTRPDDLFHFSTPFYKQKLYFITISTVDARALALRASPADVQSYSRYLARIFKMKKLITTLAMATTLIAAPAFAQ
jgi:hypothetical protein